ncbi:MAG: hypothetical protein Q9200_007291, partial [Gallowayella weberi]
MEIANPPSPASDNQTLFKKRTAKKPSNLRKRPATPPPADSDSSSGYSSASGPEGTPRLKRRRKTAILTATSNLPSKTPPTDLSATKF